MSATKNPAVRETAANPATGFKTHSPELYAKGGIKVAKYFNLKVVDLLQTCFAANPGDKQFLEIGCGTGEFTREELLPRCLPCDRVVATDVSEDMLNYAKENFSHPKIVYDALDIGGDMSSFVEKYGQFERVYSFLCLQWVKDKEAAMKNIQRLLVPGGECLLLFGVGGNTFKNFKYLAEIERWKPYKKVGTHISFQKCLRVVRQFGMVVLLFRILRDSIHFLSYKVPQVAGIQVYIKIPVQRTMIDL